MVVVVGVAGPLHAVIAASENGIQGFTPPPYRGMLSAMSRVLSLAMLCACACGAKPGATPVGDVGDPPSSRAPKRAHDPLGLHDGVTWEFAGSRTFDDDGRGVVTEPVTLIMRVVDVTTSDARTTYHVTGWPAYDPDPERPSEIVVEGGVIYLDGDAWLQFEPELASPPCSDQGLYCWTVEPSEPTGVDLYFRTGPDVAVYHLEDGLGVTGYTYHHNGTTDDLELLRVRRD